MRCHSFNPAAHPVQLGESFSKTQLVPASYAAAKPHLLHMSTTMTREYQQALEALEVVQRHAFALNSHGGKDLLAQLPSDEPPPEADVEYEENSDDGRSLQSKASMTLPVSLSCHALA